VVVPLHGTCLTLTDRQDNKGFGSVGLRRFPIHGLHVINALAMGENGHPLGLPTQRC
jgi:hypothetical protein